MDGLSKKPWDKKATLNSRKIGNRRILNSFLIYCEGEVTEPEYFGSFPTRTETEVKVVV